MIVLIIVIAIVVIAFLYFNSRDESLLLPFLSPAAFRGLLGAPGSNDPDQIRR